MPAISRRSLFGGELRTNIYSCVGALADQAMGQLFFDKGFISGNHFTLERGFSTPTLVEAEVKRKALKMSKEKFILMDYTKYGDDSLVSISSTEEIDVLITDWHIPQELIGLFSEKGVKLISAEKKGGRSS